jgi:hypothetical protein
MRDGIVLSTLSQVIGVSSKIQAVVAIVIQLKPLFWHKKRKNGKATECFEFLVRDESSSMFKMKCWGDKAIRLSGRIKSQDIVLIDNFTALQVGDEAVGMLSADTEIKLLSSRGSESSSALFCRERFGEVAARYDAIEHLRDSLG